MYELTVREWNHYTSLLDGNNISADTICTHIGKESEMIPNIPKSVF